jgi:hypothetical protein
LPGMYLRSLRSYCELCSFQFLHWRILLLHSATEDAASDLVHYPVLSSQTKVAVEEGNNYLCRSFMHIPTTLWYSNLS